MLRRETAEHGEMAAPDRVVAGHFVVENSDAQAKFPLIFILT
jgi:hypothetical protein